MNEMILQREVWFERVAWTYMPCHLKGFAVMAAIILSTVVAIILGQTALDGLGYGNADWLPFPILLVPALWFMLGIAKRHS